MRHFRRVLAASLFCATTAIASADPTWVQWPDNGHFYAVIVEPVGISWTAADAAAQALQGHLASINSAAENDFVFSLIDDAQYWKPHLSFTGVEFNLGPWIGGYQPEGSTEPNGGWQWASTEQFNYTAWVPGEPNEGPIPGQVTENRTCYWVRGSLTDRLGQWNDFHDSGCWDGDCIIAYVVERGCAAPTVTGPAAQSVCNGSTASFTVAPGGAGPFTFHWQRGNQLLTDDAHITGSDGPTLTITGTTSADAGLYACLVSDSCGPVLSSAAELLILSAVSIDGPSAQTVCAGSTAMFSVSPSGAGPFSYAWQKGGVPIFDDAHISGSATNTLTINNVTAVDVDSYACLVTGSCGPALSVAADLLVIPAINIDGPASQSVCSGGNASFNVTVTPVGSGPHTYAWQKGGQPLTNDTHIAGSDEPTLTITGLTAADIDSYACLITGPCGSILSDAASLTAIPTGTGDSDGSGTVDGRDIAGFVAAATGSPSATPSYCAYDMNLNGVVNADDLSAFVALLLVN